MFAAAKTSLIRLPSGAAVAGNKQWVGGAAHAFMRPELVLFHTYLARNHITSGSFSTSIKVSIWCRPLNGRVKIPNNAAVSD